MTVAISALCQWQTTLPVVLLACDQMITAGDIEFEPPQQKIWPLTTSIAMLIAGDTSALSEIHNAARIDIAQRLERDSSWMWVQEAANLVSRQIVTQHRNTVARAVLEPIGLTFESFLDRQPTMRPELFGSLFKEMNALRPELMVIVAGVDPSGGHIYTVDERGVILCQDASGFASIGSGARLAASQFMAARHTRLNDFEESWLLTYIAKRRAESAPGVGTNTDLAVIAGLGGFTTPAADRVQVLASTLTELDKAYAEITESAYASVKSAFTTDLDRQKEKPSPPKEDQPIASGHSASNPESVSRAPADRG